MMVNRGFRHLLTRLLLIVLALQKLATGRCRRCYHRRCYYSRGLVSVLVIQKKQTQFQKTKKQT